MKKIEQKIIKVSATCDCPLERAVDEMLLKMNKQNYRLISMSTIPFKDGGEPDIHGMTYSENEQRVMIFEKVWE